MDIIGYILAVVIGLIMGLLGGGGSILTVPIFVYLLSIEPVVATGYSLFVVGSASVVGAQRHFVKGNIDLRTGIIFAIPSLIAVYLTRRFLVPALPEEILTVGNTIINKGTFLMLLFALLMILAAISMIRKKKAISPAESKRKLNIGFVLIEGAIVGLLTGLVGAGGGFLIIPALVLISGMPMKKAIGTSLFIIAVKSLIGFIGDVQNMSLEWNFLLLFSACTIIGILLGVRLSKKISNKSLKKGFGYFVLVMAAVIIYKELMV